MDGPQRKRTSKVHGISVRKQQHRSTHARYESIVQPKRKTKNGATSPDVSVNASQLFMASLLFVLGYAMYYPRHISIHPTGFKLSRQRVRSTDIQHEQDTQYMLRRATKGEGCKWQHRGKAHVKWITRDIPSVCPCPPTSSSDIARLHT